jgi:hypothetical protein
LRAAKPFSHGRGKQKGRPAPKGRGAGHACADYVVNFGLTNVRQI